MNINWKDIFIGILIIVVVVSIIIFISIYIDLTSYISEEQTMKDLADAYNEGYGNGVTSALNGIINQINTYDFATLNVPYGNSSRVIYLQLVNPNGSN